MKRAIIALGIGLLSTQAHAHHRHKHLHHARHHHHRVASAALTRAAESSSLSAAHFSSARPRDCYGIPWCGCWLKHALGISDGKLNLNLARNWARVGRRVSGPSPHVIGVMPHHVFLVVRVLGPDRVLAISGNDGHAVRTRVRSTRGVIAWRET